MRCSRTAIETRTPADGKSSSLTPRKLTFTIFNRLNQHKVAQGSLLMFLAMILTSGVNFLLMPVWTRLMSPAEYGLFGTIFSYVGLIEAVAILGLHGALVRYYHEHADNPFKCHRALHAALYGILSIGSLIYLAVLVLAYIILKPDQGGLQFWPYVPVALIGSLFSLIITLYRSWCLARQDHVTSVLTSLASFVFILCVSLVLVWLFRWGALGRVAGVSAGACLTGAWLLAFPLRKALSIRCDWSMLRPMLAFGIPIIPHSFAMMVVAASDRLFLERMTGLGEAGRYTVVYTFTGVMGMLIQAVNSAWTPRYYAERITETGDQTIRKFNRIWTALFAVLLPLFTWIGPPVCKLMAGPDYSQAVYLAVPLSVGVFFMGTYQLAINPIFFAKKSLLVPLVSGIAAVLSIVLSLLFIPIWGAKAAAYNSVACYACMTIVAWWLSRAVNPQVGQCRALFPWFIATALIAFCPWVSLGIVQSFTVYSIWLAIVAFAFHQPILSVLKKAEAGHSSRL